MFARHFIIKVVSKNPTFDPPVLIFVEMAVTILLYFLDTDDFLDRFTPKYQKFNYNCDEIKSGTLYVS